MASPNAYSKFADYVITYPATHVAQVLLNRPQKHNAFTERMWKHFGQIFNQLSHDPEVRVIVLSGVGTNFTVGLDMLDASQGNILNGQENVDVARKAQRIRRYIEEFQDCVSAVERCEKPVICVLHGISYGIAIDISSCADVRICSADVKLSVKEVDIGIAADLGTLSRLPKIVGSLSWVKDVCLSARPFSAEEALNVGFVSGVFDTKEMALENALKRGEFLAEKSPVAVQSTKEILNHAKDHAVAESLRHTGIWNAASIQTKDVSEAIDSWKQKRRSTFEKL